VVEATKLIQPPLISFPGAPGFTNLSHLEKEGGFYTYTNFSAKIPRRGRRVLFLSTTSPCQCVPGGR
jgi:hypothetical protein